MRRRTAEGATRRAGSTTLRDVVSSALSRREVWRNCLALPKTNSQQIERIGGSVSKRHSESFEVFRCCDRLVRRGRLRPAGAITSARCRESVIRDESTAGPGQGRAERSQTRIGVASRVLEDNKACTMRSSPATRPLRVSRITRSAESSTRFLFTIRYVPSVGIE